VKEITLKVPEWVSEEELRRVVHEYLKKKELAEKFYELTEGVDFDELAKESRSFRKSFKFRNSR
jgi:hypothetical protein